MLKLPSRLLALALLLAPLGAFAQVAPSANPPIGVAAAYNASPPTCTDGQACWLQTDVNGQLKVAASVSASVTGFAPGGAYATVSSGVASADVALPAGAVVVAWNTGTTTVSCKLGIGAQTAVASQNQIPPGGSWFGFTVGSNTHIACINQAGDSATNVVVLSGGAGIPTGSGGGGSSGGGGGAVTIADGADVTLGAKADSVCGTATGTCTLQALIKFLNTSVTSSIPAGTNQIGTVSADPCAQTTKTTQAFTTSSAGPVSIVALSGSTKVYVCSISAITDTAIKLNFIDGTGGSCASAQHAIWGSTTAANGMSLAANGGFTMGNGGGTVGVTAAASAFCLLQSGTSLVAGNITYVQQ